jgi:DNA-binding Xre family transcriptional regulator
LAKRKKIKKKYEKFKVTMKKIQKLSGYGEEENPVIAIQQLSSQVSELENKVNKLLEY